MREPLSCTVELRRFGVWRAAVGAVALCALASLAMWSVASRDSRPPVALFAAAFGALALLCVAASLMRVPSGTLRRQGGLWTFAPLATPAAEAEAGELSVALDLGSFMLLIFTSGHGGGRTARRWLPAQRRGLETDWHALRCAVHAPRPAAVSRAALPE